VREEGLSAQALRDGLGLGDPHAVPEEAHRVHVGALPVQVEEDADDLVAVEALRRGAALPVGREEALGVEAHALRGLAEEE